MCPSQYITVSALNSRGISSAFYGVRAVDTDTGHFPCTFQSAVCAILIYVITKESISAFLQKYYILCIHITHWNYCLHADCGLYLHPAA